METHTETSLRSGDILAPVTVTNPVMRGSLRPRATSPDSSWRNSSATRAGRLGWLIEVFLRLGQGALLRGPQVVGVALDLQGPVHDLQLPPVHPAHELGHLVEGLVHEGAVVPHRRHTHHALLPQVV